MMMRFGFATWELHPALTIDLNTTSWDRGGMPGDLPVLGAKWQVPNLPIPLAFI